MLLHNPAVLGPLAYIAYLVASSAVRALPAPTPASSRFYLWFFTFSHSLGANWDKVKIALAIALKNYK